MRVSTDSQTTKNQVRELRDVAECRGWQIVEVHGDNGISGAKGRDQRPAFDKLHEDDGTRVSATSASEADREMRVCSRLMRLWRRR
jgi:DNA invertase Pin-like site-specific DNA recombinase